MARDVIDAALADFGKWAPASVTDQLPLLGANGLAAAAAEAERLAEDYGVLGWDRRRRTAETEQYLELLQADTRALTELTGVASAGRETAG